ncbi:MAG: lipid-A-disaccharide synthase [Bacteroidota bacterium]|nr:lipid-A-disaccharide synthase [Bacteroidota bacterium]
MKYYLIAGEASGDLHGANLIKEIKIQDPEAEFRAWGGDKMRNSGATLAQHYKDLAFMGLVDVLKNLKTIKKFLKLCKKDIALYRPDKIIFIDYPGFNLRIAEYAYHQKIETHYFISPKLWAWNTNRIKKIKKYIKQMLVIFPFEESFYAQYNYPVKYVGHPLHDELSNWRNTKGEAAAKKLQNQYNKPIIGLLPGSRKQEIVAHSKLLCRLAELYPSYQFVVAGAPSIDLSFYQKNCLSKKVPIIYDETYALIQASKVCIVASGTASLETALLKTPQLVIYKTNDLSYQVGKKLIKVKFLSLVNLILNKKAVPEIIQYKFQLRNLKKQLDLLLHSRPIQKQTEIDYQNLQNILGDTGASKRAAQEIVTFG